MLQAERDSGLTSKARGVPATSAAAATSGPHGQPLSKTNHDEQYIKCHHIQETICVALFDRVFRHEAQRPNVEPAAMHTIDPNLMWPVTCLRACSAFVRRSLPGQDCAAALGELCEFLSESGEQFDNRKASTID